MAFKVGDKVAYKTADGDYLFTGVVKTATDSEFSVEFSGIKYELPFSQENCKCLTLFGRRGETIVEWTPEIEERHDKLIAANTCRDMVNNADLTVEQSRRIIGIIKGNSDGWHDLIKNPDDLPPFEEGVEVTVETTSPRGRYWNIDSNAFYEDGKTAFNKSTIMWGYCENVSFDYSEESGDFVIRGGWYSDNGYEPCRIEDKYSRVVAWREVTAPYTGYLNE